MADDERVAPVGHLRIGTVLARRNELPAAEEHARQALGYPVGRHTVAATILLASVALRAGKTDLAKAAVAELAAADDPAQAEAGRLLPGDVRDRRRRRDGGQPGHAADRHERRRPADQHIPRDDPAGYEGHRQAATRA